MAQPKALRLTLFCIAFLLIRAFRTGEPAFFFLIWNLFLAWLPWYFVNHYHKLKGGAGRLAVLFLSILFLPNAPYIVTDLFHLRQRGVPLWFDLLLILGFVVCGLLFFFLTLRRMLQIIRQVSGNDYLAHAARALLLLASGYGIYLGRYLRFNSWQLFTAPTELGTGIWQSFFDEGSCKETLAVSLSFAIFLYLIDEVIGSFSQNRHELS